MLTGSVTGSAALCLCMCFCVRLSGNVGAAVHIGYNLIENGDHEFAWRMLEVPGMQYAQVIPKDLTAL
jgi:hypothetical protein